MMPAKPFICLHKYFLNVSYICSGMNFAFFSGNLSPCPHALANIFRAYLGQVNRWKTTNLKPLHTKLLCMVLGSTLGSSASAHLSRPHGFTVVTCLATDTSACSRCMDMGLPKPTRLSLTHFPNSCSFS